MLAINLQPYASDALEDAMRLAQTKALNSYSFSDCLNYLNYAWMDIYQKLVQIDEGYYSKTMRLTEQLTKLPPYVKNTIRIYAAREPVGFNREVFRASGYNDLQSVATYHISGTDLYCPDATRRTVWLNYIPQQPMLFFTRNNRDPKLYDEVERVTNDIYNLYKLVVAQIPGGYTYKFTHRNQSVPDVYDVTELIVREGWEVVYISCDYPYVFVTYRHKVMLEEHRSGFFKNILGAADWTEYNPFEYTGRGSNVEYYKTSWNDKTGMGVTVKDWNDQARFKELGWTPDTLLTYPSPEVYRYLVALLADKFAALNESDVMGVQKELVEARYAFMNFLKKDKSAWGRIDNVNGPTISDLL
jgi:hypothetical protein